jgi:DegV family protein with EDD domain
MTNLKIVTDSSCDLPEKFFDDYAIGVVPINIRFGDKDFLEGVDIDEKTFYEKIKVTGALPKTSQPSVGQFIERYLNWARQGVDTILSIHVASTLSGTVNSAMVAAQEVADKIRVIPFDTLSGSAAMGFMCVEAAQLARLGKSAEEIVARLTEARQSVRISLTLETLKYAAMSGRISNIQAFVASVLNIKPIVTLREGQLLADGRVRSRAAALERLIDLTRDAAGQASVNIAVIHSGVQSEADELLARLKQSLNVVDSFVGDITLSLAAHFGPGVIGTVVYPHK